MQCGPRAPPSGLIGGTRVRRRLSPVMCSAPSNSVGTTRSPVNPLVLWDPYVLLTCAAQLTTRIGLGTLIENAVLDHPVSVASSIATLDAVSNGRALLGYGTGDTSVRYLGQAPATIKEMEAALLAVKRSFVANPSTSRAAAGCITHGRCRCGWPPADLARCVCAVEWPTACSFESAAPQHPRRFLTTHEAESLLGPLA